MRLSFVTLDVFTETQLIGNPLAIIHLPLSTPLTQDVKQAVAREFNLSEIVFLHEQSTEDVANEEVKIDIFTAYAEVPFAGHPTIGAGVYLLHHLHKKFVTALRTKAGRKTIVKSDDGVSIDLPHNVHIHDTPFAGKPYAHYPVVSIVKGMTFILAKFQNLEELAAQYDNLLGMRNCYTSYSALDQDWREGIVTSFYYVDIGVDERSGRRRLRTRSFGAREDPGTGSASAALSSYLTLTESGPRVRRYHLTQGVEIGRQCDIFVDVALSEAGSTIESVILYGNAVKVMEGVIDVPFGGH